MKVTIPFSYFKNEPSLFDQPEFTVRNGRGDKVRILCTDGSIPDYPVVGIVEHEDPSLNRLSTYTKDGKYMTNKDTPYSDLVVEVDNDAVIKKTGFDPLKAAVFATAMFGDSKQYSPEELELISMISLAMAAE